MRGSSKPCPGCGQVKLGRPAKEVCLDCKRLLERAEWLENELVEMAKGKVTVAFAQQSHWNEYIYTHSGKGRGLMEIFFRLARGGASSPVTRKALSDSAEIDNLLGRTDSGAPCHHVVMSAPLAEAIRDLRVAVQEALEQEYVAGKADGHNLLMRLASGEISTGAFDAKVNEG